jgi:hypothetical protein
MVIDFYKFYDATFMDLFMNTLCAYTTKLELFKEEPVQITPASDSKLVSDSISLHGRMQIYLRNGIYSVCIDDKDMSGKYSKDYMGIYRLKKDRFDAVYELADTALTLGVTSINYDDEPYFNELTNMVHYKNIAITQDCDVYVKSKKSLNSFCINHKICFMFF